MPRNHQRLHRVQLQRVVLRFRNLVCLPVLVACVGCAEQPRFLHESVIRARIEALSDESPGQRDRYLAEASQAQKNPDRIDRASAIIALSRSPNHGQYRVLRMLANDVDPSVSIQAIYGLGILNDPTAVPFLLKELRDEENFWAALAALKLLRRGLYGHEPLSASSYVAEYPLRDFGIANPRTYTRSDVAKEFEQWWSENKDRLMRERKIGEDFWAK